MKIILGITGASGVIYAQRIIHYLEREKENDIAVVITDAGKQVWKYELKDYPIEIIPFKIYANDDYFAPFASGSSEYETMIIAPCTMGTMGKIANGIADSLLTRAADVMLKENRKLIIVPREMPYNLIHIENMKKLKLAGADICQASPSFYSLSRDINSLVDTVVQKIFHLAGIELKLFKWGQNNNK